MTCFGSYVPVLPFRIPGIPLERQIVVVVVIINKKYMERVNLLVLVYCVSSLCVESLEVSAGLDGLAVGTHRVLAGV